MTASTRWFLTALVVVVFYAVLMTGVIGTYEFLILMVLAITGLYFIWRGASRKAPE